MAKRGTGRVEIEKTETEIPHLDDVLGGGLPELSVIVVAGAPGTGKTVLTQQILFNVASPEHPGGVLRHSGRAAGETYPPPAAVCLLQSEEGGHLQGSAERVPR